MSHTYSELCLLGGSRSNNTPGENGMSSTYILGFKHDSPENEPGAPREMVDSMSLEYL